MQNIIPNLKPIVVITTLAVRSDGLPFAVERSGYLINYKKYIILCPAQCI